MNTAWCLNTAWMLSCSAEHAAFTRSLRRVAQTQARLLRRLLHDNRHTWFGQRHDFDRIDSPRTYQTRVPATTYGDYAGAVDRIAAGEANVLTAEPVRLLEPTSGTTGGEKLIPYTAGLRRQFQRGVAAWIADLFSKQPAVRRGPAYWSISPALGPPRVTPGGIPIGFAEDAAYLGRLEQFILRRLLVVPGAMHHCHHPETATDLTAFRYCTLRFLLAAADLSLISVWSPTFLLALLDLLPAWHDRLCDDLSRGTLCPPQPVPAGPLAALQAHLRPAPRRAALLRDIFLSPTPLAAKLRQVWPRLALISCWNDAAAAQFLPALEELFPAIEIQPKGLLATEAFVSLPLLGLPAAALAVRSHFFEFEELTAGRIHLAHELDAGGRYRVLVTTAGGLYRYHLRDEIDVVAQLHQCPLLCFRGKSDLVCDLVGEKLADPHVRGILASLPTFLELAPSFALLVPVLEQPPRYRLYLQGPPAAAANLLPQLARELQAGLQQNPYYRHAVALGQLAPAEATLLDPDAASAYMLLERRALERGQRIGNLKPAVLDSWTGWPERFAPLLSASAEVLKRL